MTISATVFSSVGQRRLLPVTMPDDASTVRHALELSGEREVPADCEIFMDGERVNLDTQVPSTGTANITVNRKTKGNH